MLLPSHTHGEFRYPTTTYIGHCSPLYFSETWAIFVLASFPIINGFNQTSCWSSAKTADHHYEFYGQAIIKYTSFRGVYCHQHQGFSETSVNIYQTTRCNIPEDNQTLVFKRWNDRYLHRVKMVLYYTLSLLILFLLSTDEVLICLLLHN
jgi:hypothetical protein